jgi:peptidoglycan/xylan/chitin deacetylase (PgdA/CDA1 family)
VHGAALALLGALPAVWPWVLTVLLANHVSLGIAGLWPRSRILGPNRQRLPAVAAGRSAIALTFDDGPDPAVTIEVLDALDAYGAKASFFCIGERAAAHPDLVSEIIRRGHSVENHSQRHPYSFACFGPGRMRREIEAAQQTIGRAAGRAPRFFRAPAGLRNPFLDRVMAQTGLYYMSWTRRGFDAVRGDPEGVLARLTRRLAPGDVLLLHDGTPAKTPDGRPVVLAVLPKLLALLKARGLVSISLPEAFGLNSPGALPSPRSAQGQTPSRSAITAND